MTLKWLQRRSWDGVFSNCVFSFSLILYSQLVVSVFVNENHTERERRPNALLIGGLLAVGRSKYCPSAPLLVVVVVVVECPCSNCPHRHHSHGCCCCCCSSAAIFSVPLMPRRLRRKPLYSRASWKNGWKIKKRKHTKKEQFSMFMLHFESNQGRQV